MPDHPRAVTEAEFSRTVTDLLKLYGWKHYHTHDSRRSEAGFPDLFCVHPRYGVLALELKTEKGRLTRAQADWGTALNNAGVPCECWRPSISNRHMVDVLQGAANLRDRTGAIR